MNIMGIAAEDIQQGDKCVAGGSYVLLPLITLATDIENACVALGDAMYGDFVTVFCPEYNYNNKELL